VSTRIKLHFFISSRTTLLSCYSRASTPSSQNRHDGHAEDEQCEGAVLYQAFYAAEGPDRWVGGENIGELPSEAAHSRVYRPPRQCLQPSWCSSHKHLADSPRSPAADAILPCRALPRFPVQSRAPAYSPPPKPPPAPPPSAPPCLASPRSHSCPRGRRRPGRRPPGRAPRLRRGRRRRRHRLHRHRAGQGPSLLHPL
jgi:hypothetical protein